MDKFNRFAFRDLLQDRGMSQAQMSREIGINPTTISRWARGKRMPSTDRILKLAKVLRVDPSQLVISERYKGEPI